MTTTRRALAPLAALALALLGGCAAPGTHATLAEPGYTTAYAQGRYDQALRDATAAADRGSPAERAEAALIAGQAAHALNRPDEARRWLEPLATHDNPAVAGRAGSTLGLIARSKGEHERAAALLSAAAGRLAGDMGARAALYAGDSYAALHRPDDARREYARAQSLVADDKALARQIADRLAGRPPASQPTPAPAATTAAAAGPYTIQLGAFASKPRAESLAASAASKARAQGLGEPRLVPGSNAAGTAVYFVRVGYFPSRTAAASARARLGLSGIVTETAGERR